MDRDKIYDLREFKDLTIVDVRDRDNYMQLMYDLGNNNNIYFEVSFSQDRIDFFKELTKNIIEALRRKIALQNRDIEYLKKKPTNISFVCPEPMAKFHKPESSELLKDNK